MTDEQYTQVQRLKCCTFLPGSYDKRFIRDIATKPKDYELTDKQAQFLAKLWYKYRRQIWKNNATA